MNKKLVGALVSLLIGGAAAVGNIVPPIIATSEYSKAFFAPGEWREIVFVDYQQSYLDSTITVTRDTLKGSFGKTYLSKLYGESMMVVQIPIKNAEIVRRRTHRLDVIHGSGTDHYYASNPVWRPSPDAQIAWRTIVLANPDSNINSGDGYVTADSIFIDGVPLD